MSRKSIFIIMLTLFLFSPVVYGVDLVHDPIGYINAIEKKLMDKAYEALTLDFDAEDLGLTTKQLEEMKKTLQNCKEIYANTTKIFDTAMTIKGFIGDPMGMATYLNKEFTRNDDLGTLLKISKSVMNLDPNDMMNLGFAFSFSEDLLRKADDVFGGNKFENASLVAEKQAKRAAIVDKTVDEAVAQSKKKVMDLDKMAGGVSDKASVSSILYGIFQGTMFLADTVTRNQVMEGEHYKNVANYIAGENQEKQSDLESQAKAVTENDQAQKASIDYMKTSSVKRINCFYDETDPF